MESEFFELRWRFEELIDDFKCLKVFCEDLQVEVQTLKDRLTKIDGKD